MYRFLLQRRWLALHLVVLALVPACVMLGNWQWARHEERRMRAALVARNTALPPAPYSQLLASAGEVPAAQEWRLAEATGRYDADATVLVRNRSHADGGTGYEVLVPLITPDGPVLVNRGWVARVGGQAPQLPEIPPGAVTVTGYLRRGQPAEGGAGVDTSSSPPTVSRVVPAAVAELTGHRLDDAYVQAREESPATGQVPLRVEPPDLTSWRNVSYAAQWYLFAVVAVVGWVLLVRREARDRAVGEAPNRLGPTAGVLRS